MLGGGGIPFRGGGGGAMFGGGGGEAALVGALVEGKEGIADPIGGAGGTNGLEVNDEDGPIGEEGEGVEGLLAASSAFILASLSSLPASIIPERVPVKNVAIGIISSKNFWSIGEIAFRG